LDTITLVTILIALSSAIIALLSLIYAIKQRQVVKGEIEKKRYLENAQTNLTEIIKQLRSIVFPKLSDDFQEALEDEYHDANTIAEQILRASFESKKTKFTLEVSYELIDFGLIGSGKPDQRKEPRQTSDFSQSSPRLLKDLLEGGRSFLIESNTTIIDYEPRVKNEIDFHDYIWSLKSLKNAVNMLASYEEVYDAVCPNISKSASQLFEQLSEELFNLISEPKRIELDLTKFSKVDDIARYLFETYLNYNHISQKFSEGVSELDSRLTEARRQLFLRISP
jgi:hypothetical protein